MRRFFFAATGLMAVAFGASRNYDVGVYQNLNGRVWAAASQGAGQTWTCVSDSLLWVETFIGDTNRVGTYRVDILSDGQRLYTGEAASGPDVHCTYVHADLERTSSEKLVKGKKYDLRISLDDATQADSINYYYDETNPYHYGHLVEPGQDQNHPEEYYSKDLVCRIEGIVYNNPEMISTWDMIPWPLVKPSLSGHPYITVDSAKHAITNGAAAMENLGVRGNRIVDLWKYVQPDSTQPLVFNWDSVDFCWRTLAGHGIHPHLVAQGGGAWRCDDSVTEQTWGVGWLTPMSPSSTTARRRSTPTPSRIPKTASG